MISTVYSKVIAAVCASVLSIAANATIVNVDLSGASTGTLITAPGASFATSFSGQTVTGNTLSGSPTGPLSLVASGSLTVSPWNGSNSILPQPGNLAPLSVLLDSAADSFELIMGSSNSGTTVVVDFFDSLGGLVNSATQVYSSGYNTYSFSGFGTFSGISFHSNNDPSGVRYMDMSYNSVAVSEPGSIALLGLGLIALSATRRKLNK